MLATATILIVDDDPTSINLLSKTLGSDYTLVTADSGIKALELAEDIDLDLILLDIMMPEIDGLETLRRLRQSHWGRDIPVILITADERTATQVSGLAQGADDFITKPVIMPVVQARVRNVLERRRLWAQLRKQEEQYRRLSEDAPICICSFLPDGTLLYVNQTLADLAGASVSALQGQRFYEHLSAEEGAMVKTQLAMLTPAQPLETHEQIHPQHDGEPRIIQWTNRAFFDGAGTVHAYQGIGVDITERKQAEEQLRFSNQLLTALLETTQSLTGDIELKQSLPLIVENAVKTMGLDSGALYLLAGSDKIGLAAAIPPLPDDFEPRLRMAALNDHPHIQSVIESGHHLLLSTPSEAVLSPSEQQAIELRDLGSLLFLPIRLRQQVIGVLILASQTESHVFSEDNIQLMQWFADQAAHVIDNLRHYAAAQQYAQQLEHQLTEQKYFEYAMGGLNGDLARLSGQEFYRGACRLLTEVLDTELAFIGRLHRHSEQVEVIDGWADGQAMPPFFYALQHTPCAHVLEQGVACYTQDVQSQFPQDELLVDMGIQAYIGQALFDKQGQPLGILVALGRHPLEETLGRLAPDLLELFIDRVTSEILRSDAEQGMCYQLEFKHIAAETATALATARDESQLNLAIDQCLRRLGRLSGADRSYLFQFYADLTRMDNTHEWCAAGISAQRDSIQNTPTDDLPWWKQHLFAHGVININKVSALPPDALVEQAEWQRQNIQSLVNIAMYGAHGTLIGFIGFDSVSREREWSTDELTMLRTLAGIIGSAIERQRAEVALREQEHHFRDLADGGTALIFTSDTDKRCTYFNQPWLRFTGQSVQQEQTHGWITGVHPDDVAPCRAQFHQHFDRREPLSMEFRLRHADGDYRWVLAQGNPRYDSRGQFIGYINFCYDITERKHAEERLQLAASVFEHASEGITITDAQANILDVNAAFTRITGYSREEVIGKNPRILNSGRQSKAFYADMWHTLHTQGRWMGEIWNRRKNGEVYAELLTLSVMYAADGQIQRYIALFSDISAQKEHQQQLEHIAHYDVLTGLPNRVLLADRLRQAMAQAIRRNEQIAVAYLDLDGFKAINDTYGHAAGDRLLVEVAQHLKQILREGDTLARPGGDEFVVVLNDLPNMDACLSLVRRLLNTVAESVDNTQHSVHISASLGVSVYPQAESIDADQLLRQADQAMYQAKLAGKNRYYLFDAVHDRELRERHERRKRIRQALIEQEFRLYYQPKVNMRNGAVIGAEALIRWQHPERGLLSPGHFLALIEDHPLMVELGDWVIEAALKQIRAWRAAGMALPVSVNVDALQLGQADFIDKLREVLVRYPEVQPGDLELEILETSTLQDITQVSEILRAGKALGLSFALDDFGTGYSSLSYLKRLPVETLKIDQSFVRDMLDDPDDLAILEGIIGLAEAFRRQVVAEGVETAAHGELLLQLGCELGQGYAIGRPMPPEQIPEWHRQWQPEALWINTQPVAHHRLPILLAIVEHRAWFIGLCRYLRDEQTHIPPLDAHNCHVGHWLDAEAERGNLDPATYAQLTALHDDIHQQAYELMALKQSRDTALNSVDLEAMKTQHNVIIEALRELIG